MNWIPRTFMVITCVYVLLILGLVFAQFPSFDDLVPKYLVDTFGHTGSIDFYLTNLNGRYSSIPLFLLLGSSASLMEHYQLILLCFNLVFLVILYDFSKWVLHKFFDIKLGFLHQAAVTSSLFLIFFTSVPEPASFTYWLATLETYTLPFFCLLLLLKQYGRLLTSEKPDMPTVLLCTLLTVLLAGSNEFLAMTVLVIPGTVMISFAINRRRIPYFIFLTILIAIISIAVIVKLPGNVYRTDNYVNKENIFFSLAGGIFRLNKATMNFLSNPLFYLGCVAAFFLSQKLKPDYTRQFSAKKSTWWMEVMALYLVVLGFHFIVRQVGEATLPDRISNIINCAMILCLWGIIILNGSAIHKKIELKFLQGSKLHVLQLSFCVLLIFSSFTHKLLQNMLAAPIHHYVLSERISLINQAKAAGRKTVTIPNYDSVAFRFIADRISSGKVKTYMDEFPLPPAFSYFKDEPSSDLTAYFYAEYYGIDTIRYGSKTFLRWGLSDQRLDKR